MPSALYTVTIDISVHDETALFAAAVAHYVNENACNTDAESDAASLLKPEGEVDIGACLVQLLDPGLSPAGCAIENSSWSWSAYR